MKMIYVSAVSRPHSLAANEFGCAYRRYNHQPIIQPKCLEHEKSNIASQKTGDAGEYDSRDVDAEEERAEVALVVVLHVFRCRVAFLRLRHASLKRRTCAVYKSIGFMCGTPELSCFLVSASPGPIHMEHSFPDRSAGQMQKTQGAPCFNGNHSATVIG